MKIPLSKIKIGMKIRVTGGFPNKPEEILTFVTLPDHYSSFYPDQPCFNSSWCGLEYELLNKKPTIIIGE